MGLMEDIQDDIREITTDTDDFALPVIFSVTDGVTVTTVTCGALAIKHNLAVDENTGVIRAGIICNGRSVRVSVSEGALTALAYPVRNTNNQVSLIGHTVTWTDVSGVQATYVIREHYPDESTGLIVCFLGDYGVVTPPGRLIIGWTESRFDVKVVTTVDPDEKQTLANGDEINVQYALNVDGTLTIPYLATYMLNVLTPFIIDNIIIQDEPYDQDTGTFDNSAAGGFLPDINIISFNAMVPIWQA